MATEAQRAPVVRERTSFASAIRRIIAAIEPWYDWGKTATISRFDAVERDFTDESEGDGWAIELQWLGFHIGLVIGRLPPKITADEVSARKRSLVAQKAVRS